MRTTKNHWVQTQCASQCCWTAKDCHHKCSQTWLVKAFLNKRQQPNNLLEELNNCDTERKKKNPWLAILRTHRWGVFSSSSVHYDLDSNSTQQKPAQPLQPVTTPPPPPHSVATTPCCCLLYQQHTNKTKQCHVTTLCDHTRICESWTYFLWGTYNCCEHVSSRGEKSANIHFTLTGYSRYLSPGIQLIGN